MSKISSQYIPIAKRFPKVYQQFLEDMKRPRSRIHCRAPENKFFYDKHQHKVFKTPDAPIGTYFLPESHKGIWGGESAVKAYRMKKDGKGNIPTLWVPFVIKHVVYSEILDKYFQIETTEYALEQMDKHFGFDNYILETPVQDLSSQMALDIRRKLLLALVREEIYPDDVQKREHILKKYAKFIIPEEEAEWFGLNLREATLKLLKQEEEAEGIPMKASLRARLIEKLKAQQSETN